MSTIQHVEAARLLPIIVRAAKNFDPLTYEMAAERLGRPKNNARMVAQVCDLLDAAAAYAGTPLLALVAVREKSGKINRKAWADRDYRELIVECSLRHKFTDADFAAIGVALKKLNGKSNRKAWDFIWDSLPKDEIIRRLTTDMSPNLLDAIDDIGTDLPDRFPVLVASYARDAKVRENVKVRANGKCEFCGEPGFLASDGKPYLECHHIVALAKEGADRMTNVIALCPNDHREAHFGKRRDALEKEMTKIVRSLQG